MIKGIKVMLLPNKKQCSKLFECAGVKRFAYNRTLAKEQENYKNVGKFIDDDELRREFTKLKQTEEYEWLNNYSNNITKKSLSVCSDGVKYKKVKEKTTPIAA